MNHSLKEVSEWLNAHKQQELTIQKRELDDLDEIRLTVDSVELQDGDNCSIDDYLACQVLLLRGSGVIVTDTEEAPLPAGTFTIPVENLTRTDVQEQQVTLENGRGVYTISV
ncbi:hypothetical protein [Paenibacillus lemnae]|uniref:Uncharacterized protein n=1 Tax=Paenibacillus lemnae TaxID=1330551 RepID=A0A848M9E7_PAELE|nr:hypothetical protein [Paenibacillus lemnae]NMO97236.1 hypothetical protein [Paenibacillus lemnae]